MGDFYYEIENKASQMCLSSNTLDETVLLESYDGDDNQKWRIIPAEQSWMYNIELIYYTTDPPEGGGWEKIGHNLNLGNGGNQIYLWVRGSAKDNIELVYYTLVPPEGEGWEKVGHNLNLDTSGNQIYLWVRGPAKDNIEVLYHNTIPPEGDGWMMIGGDLNAGAGGYYIYLWVR